MKAKRISTFCGATVLCGAALAGVALALPINVYAESNKTVNISISKQPQYCTLYSDKGQATCDNTYGSYDYTNSTINIGEGVNGQTIWIDYNDEKEKSRSHTYIIKADTDFEADFSIPKNDTIVIDLGDHTWTTVSAYGYPTGGNIIVKSGHVVGSINANGITVNGGALTIGKDNSFHASGQLLVNGGVIDSGADIETHGFSMSGGTVTVNGSGYGIYIDGDSDFIITGGTLNISNTLQGILLSGDGVARFDGGNTTIENSKTYAVHVVFPSDPKTAIIFGENVKISDDSEYDWWYGSGNSIAIVAEELFAVNQIKSAPKDDTPATPADTEKDEPSVEPEPTKPSDAKEPAAEPTEKPTKKPTEEPVKEPAKEESKGKNPSKDAKTEKTDTNKTQTSQETKQTSETKPASSVTIKAPDTGVSTKESGNATALLGTILVAVSTSAVATLYIIKRKWSKLNH